jgi:hypothetical protein
VSLCAGTARSAEPVKIRVSWIAPLTNWASILLERKHADLGIFEAAAKRLK